MADVSWQLLEGIGAYVAYGLSGEDVGRMERFVWEDDEAQRLTGSYARLLTLLKAVGEEAPEMPEAVIDRADQWAAEEAARKYGPAEDALRRKEGET